jgi:hypothetical protein
MAGEKDLSEIDQNGRSFVCEILSLAPEHVSQTIVSAYCVFPLMRFCCFPRSQNAWKRELHRRRSRRRVLTLDVDRLPSNTEGDSNVLSAFFAEGDQARRGHGENNGIA